MGNGATQSDSTTTSQQNEPEQNIIRQQSWCPRYEYNDGVKIEIPAHLQRPLTIQEELRRFCVTTMSQIIEDNESGTLGDEDDFEDDEPYNLMS